MLLRNLNPSKGLVNAEIATGSHAGDIVVVPGIPIESQPEQIGIHFQRLQFPVRLAFALTINKSQDDLERMQNRYLQEHFEKNENEVQLFGAGRLGFRHLDVLRSHITHLPVKRDRERSFPLASSHRLKRCLRLRGERQRNCEEGGTGEIIGPAEKKYCDWLHSEFDVHLVHVFAIDSIRANSSADFVCNSGVGQRFNQFFTASTGLTPERYMRYLVSSCGPNIKARLQGLPSASFIPGFASSVSFSASSILVSVLSTETEHTYKEKRRVHVKAIREIVHRMLSK
ncbi:hypothetical protein EDC96DRAFT_593144 [Choanephora cucurbitarum]|nr:hypothetical protein EDC96DRAFT_593144 [Choanephora cucurbitarum]